MHRNIAINDRFVVATGEGAPSIHAHLVADLNIMHPCRSADHEFVDALFVLTLETEC